MPIINQGDLPEHKKRKGKERKIRNVNTLRDIYRSEMPHEPRDEESDDSMDEYRLNKEVKETLSQWQTKFKDPRMLAKIGAWLVGLVLASRYGFGIVFFIVSLLLGMYFNTTTKKSSDTPSAYSVFNRNFERIQGDRDAGSVDKQLRGGQVW